MSRQLRSVIDRAVKEEEDNEDSTLTGGAGAGRFFLRSVELLVRHLDSMYLQTIILKKKINKKRFGELESLVVILDFHWLFLIFYSSFFFLYIFYLFC